MLTYQNNKVRTSVRRLVEFLFRSGDLVSGSALTADPQAMQEGSRLHRKLQNAKPATYHSEVPLIMQWSREGYELILEGRADGIDINQSVVLIDEIKCVYRDVELIEEAEELHLAQAKCYAYMYGAEHSLDEILVQITYCNMDTEDTKELVYTYTMKELEEWFLDVQSAYEMWADYFVEARNERNESISEMSFPFEYRPGQKQMAAMVYQAVERQKHIFLQAPTGIGKTISTLYPVLKEMGQEKAEKIFYLTAKTITRTAAENALMILRRQKLALKTVTMTAKEKICIQEKMECDPRLCERAKGHFDRVNQALFRLLTGEHQINREVILDYSRQYQVCPYELTAEAAVWVDCVICDYNYIFDPHVNLRGPAAGGNKKQAVYLVDEAHNLLDRAREMYSASLQKDDFRKAVRYFRDHNEYIVKKLKSCVAKLVKIEKNPETAEMGVDELYFPLLRLLGPLEDYLKDHTAFEEREELVQFFFNLRHFFFIMERKEEGYQIYTQGEKRTFAVHLLCVDPSSCLEEYLERSRATIFFSATLLPIMYYTQLLGGSGNMDAFAIPSPFPGERRLLAIASDVTSRYSCRGENQYRRMIRYLEMTVGEKTGNYIIFFPSYEMLNICADMAKESNLSVITDILIQESSMGEKEREEFLTRFREDSGKSLVAFCVLGSIFSEGIDLIGKRLIGVLIVGTGLPQVCREREMIRAYFDTHDKKGYDYAYRYPGMNKVLQAAGRVIRAAEDTGMILLMDDRFLQKENQRLLPEEWDSFYEVSERTYPTVLKSFWEKYKDEA